MTELALSILDLATNSQSAKADTIEIDISISVTDDLLSLTIKDNGCGISQKHIKMVTDPFYTTRTTRKVGMGLPLFRMMCEQCEGSFEIISERGTTLSACLKLSSVDRPPLGDMGSTLTTLIHGVSNIRYIFRYSVNENAYIFDTEEIKQVVGGDIAENAILTYLSEMINENIENINGGLII